MADAIYRYANGQAFERWDGQLSNISALERPLYRMYALLALSAIDADDIGMEDIHNAWSIWCASFLTTEHRSLKPFKELSPEVQELDGLYLRATQYVCMFGWNR